MMLALSIFVFFFSFYRLEVLAPNIYPAALFGLVGLVILVSKANGVIKDRVYASAIYFFLFLSLFSFMVDFFTGAIIKNFSNSFFVRCASILVLSFSTAYIINFIYLRGSWQRLVKLVFWAFSFQLVFWLITYFSPSAKERLYAFFMQGDSVNLRDHNISARGFGISKEINFTSPFMMVVVSLMIFKGRMANGFSFLTVLTQIINSNLALVGAAIGLGLSSLKLYLKFIVVLIGSLVVIFLGGEYFIRLYDEIDSGGVRTINSLLKEHFFILNDGLFEHLFGGWRYIFQGGEFVHSDVGWVIMYNYGGVFFVGCFLALLGLMSVMAFGLGRLSLFWFLSGLILNTKGLVFGPNAYIFMTFIFFFMKSSERMSSGYNASARANSIMAK